MAKKKRYRKGGPARLDMRKGGRVRLHGGSHWEETESGYSIWVPHDPDDPNHMGGAAGSGGSGSGSSGPAVGETRTNENGETEIWNGTAWVKQGTGAGEYSPSDQEVFEDKRGKRIIKAGDTAEEIAAGNIPTGVVPKADVETLVDPATGDVAANTLADTVTLDPSTKAVATTLKPEEAEKVDTMTAETARQAEKITASTYDASLITDKPDVQAAIGELSDESIAKVEEIVELSGPAKAAEITEQIANAAKAKNVDAIISAGAFVPEVKGVGAQISDCLLYTSPSPRD